MPHVKVYKNSPGWNDADRQEMISKIGGVLAAQKLLDKAVISFSMEVPVRADNAEEAPYVEVRDEKPEEAMQLAKLLNRVLSMDVEVLPLTRFIAAPVKE